jgi:hypothetical protein
MIHRSYNDIYTTWRSLVDELCYGNQNVKGAFTPQGANHVLVYPIRWGVCMSYPDLLEADIEDALYDPGMHLDMSSYTKSRWTRFLRRYFRPDLEEWVDRSMEKLQKYPSRPFVSSYSININVEDEEGRVGHNYGGCISSLQIRLNPRPTVILFSRACQMDKIGLLDFILVHLIAKRMQLEKVSARWVVSLPFVSAISQVYYVKRFNLPLKGHRLERRIRQNSDREIESVTYGPLKRLLKRNKQMKEFGTIPHSVPVAKLTLNFDLAKKKAKNWQEP